MLVDFFFLLPSIFHVLENITECKWWWGTDGKFHHLQPFNSAQGGDKKSGWTDVFPSLLEKTTQSVMLYYRSAGQREHDDFKFNEGQAVAIAEVGSLKV